jgi:SAM-dependent methyltransferase
MSDLTDGKGLVPVTDSVGNTARYYKKDFWSKENLKYSQPHYRLQKSARIIEKLTRGKDQALLDVGCGPAALMRLLPPNIRYYGIDISIPAPAPNLIETDFVENRIAFDDLRFDIIMAQGVFEYIGNFQSQKFAEIAGLLKEHGTFIVSYVNFGHRDKSIYWPYNNVQPFEDFRKDLGRYFNIDGFFPTSHNWNHTEPNRKLIKAVNMHININVPLISPMLAVEYFFICSSRDSERIRSRH